MPVDYEKEAAALLTRRFRDTNVADLVKALVGALQESDDVAESLPTALYDVDAAEGVQLASLADLVGAPLLGTDAEVRVLVRAWIRRNRSRGQHADLIEVLELAGAQDFDVDEIFPASIETTVFSVLEAIADKLALIVEGTRAAAIGSKVVFSEQARAATFQYSSTTSTQTSTTTGYGYGVYAGVIVA